jgi:hypothetical protein
MTAENFNEEDWERNKERDMAKIWESGLLKYLCEKYRERTNRGETTDFRIEDVRNDRFSAWGNPEHFRRCVVGLPEKHYEIEIEGGNIVRLTPFGLNSCASIPG